MTALLTTMVADVSDDACDDHAHGGHRDGSEHCGTVGMLITMPTLTMMPKTTVVTVTALGRCDDGAMNNMNATARIAMLLRAWRTTPISTIVRIALSYAASSGALCNCITSASHTARIGLKSQWVHRQRLSLSNTIHYCTSNFLSPHSVSLSFLR